MDKQFACGTFATVIPVLVIAIYSASSRISFPEAPGGRWVIATKLAYLTASELTAIVGVVSPNTDSVMFAESGAGAGTVLLAYSIVVELIRGPRRHPEDPDPNEHGGGAV